MTTWQGISRRQAFRSAARAHQCGVRQGRYSARAETEERAAGLDPTGLSVRAFNKAYYAELARWTKVAKDAGLKAE